MILVFGAYFAMLIGIALVGARKMGDMSEYVLGGRRWRRLGSDLEPKRRGHVALSLVEGEEAYIGGVPSEVQSNGDVPEVRAPQIAGPQDGRHLIGQGSARKNPFDSCQDARVEPFALSRKCCPHFGFEQVRGVEIREVVHTLGGFDSSMLFELKRDHN